AWYPSRSFQVLALSVRSMLAASTSLVLANAWTPLVVLSLNVSLAGLASSRSRMPLASSGRPTVRHHSANSSCPSGEPYFLVFRRLASSCLSGGGNGSEAPGSVGPL